MSRPPTKRQAQDLVSPYGKHPRVELVLQNAVDAVQSYNKATTSAEGTNQMCRKCRKIDFEAIFDEDRQDSRLYKIWGNQSILLSHISQQSNCTLCQFFYSTREPPLDETTVDPVYSLHVFPAKGELGAWQLGFDDSPAFIVVPSQDNYLFNFQNTNGIIVELSKLPGSFYGRQIQPQVDLSIIKGWLKFCDNNHNALCKWKSNAQVPQGFRIIDCLTRKIVSWDKVAPYYTICDPQLCLGKFRGGVYNSERDPPKRFASYDRGHHSLDNKSWLSIFMDRPSMGAIYQHSVITVVAAAGDDPHYDLPGIGVAIRKHQPCAKIGERTLIYTPYARKEIQNSKWNSRGWTYQEGLLSRRKLVFTPTQVYFQCNAMHCLESIHAPLKDLHTYKNVRMRDKVEISRVFPLRGFGKNPKDLELRLNEYLQRSFTFEIDVLDAFKGILASFEQIFSSKMRLFCGIPIITTSFSENSLDALVLGLSWGYYRGQEPERRLGFPSWSWMGWKLSEIIFQSSDPSKHKATVGISVEYTDGLVLPWDGN